MKVLVVEDEATVAQAIEALLVSHHYAVDIAKDGLEGLEMAEVYSYDLMVLDIGLPGIDGLSLCQQLRTRGMQTPILLLTGQDVEAHAKAVALNAGADDYVTKPFDAEELLARLQTLLRRGALKALPVLQWGALSLDPSRLQVSYGSALLNLTPKEYTLLEVLLRHAPNILNARVILEQGWNALENPSDEAIRTHVKEVRKKLKAAGAPEDFIKTVHRQGYRLNPLYGEAVFAAPEGAAGSLPMAELKALNEELRTALEKLHFTQTELQQRNQELQAARDELETRVAARTAEMAADLDVLEMLRSLSTRFVSNGDLQALYDEILNAALRLMGADGGTLQILNPVTQELTLLATVGFDRTMTEHFARVSAKSGTPCGRALATGQRILARFDVPASADPDGSLCLHREAGYRSAQSTPLISRLGNAIGMISTHWHHPHQPTERDLRFLDLLARQAADLIERQRAEVALLEQKNLLRLTLSGVQAGAWSWDCGSEQLTWNDRLFELLGYRPGEVSPSMQAWRDRIHPDDLAWTSEALQRTLEGHELGEVEYRVIHPDGSVHWLLVRGQGVYDELDRLVQMVGMALEISDRKHTEAALYQSEKRYRQLVELAPQLVWHADTQGHTYISPQLCDYTGLSPDQLLDFGWPMVIHPDDASRIDRRWQESVQTGTPYEAEYRLRRADGEYRWHLARAIPLDSDQGMQWFGVSIDISDRKAAELALQQQVCQEQLLADIAQEIRQSLELNQVLHSTVDRVREWLKCDRVIIFRFRPDWQGDVIMESVGDGWPAILATTIVDPCFADRLIEPYRQGHVSVLNDIHQAGLEPCYVELLAQFQVRASLAVPILQGNGLWGLLIAHHCAAPCLWQAAEITILKRLSTQVGIAIQQAELYAQIRQELAQRARMQTVLQESEARFRTLSAAAPVGILQTNADGICLYANAAWQQMAGLSLENSLGNGWLRAVHPEDRGWVLAAWEAYLEDQRVEQAEFRLLTPQRATRWISARAATLKSATDEIVGYVLTYEDITERKQAEQALRDSEQRLQAILDHSPAIIYVIDPQSRHLLANRSYADQLATTPDHLVGKTLHEVWPEETADRFAASNQTILATGQLLQIEDTAPLADGLHSYITVKFPLCDETGTPYAICGISTDITDRKRLEAQFYQAQRLESLGTLAAGIAHDLNNVLTPILTVAQILRLTQKGLDAKGLEQLKLLESSAKRGASLVKQVLTVTRASEGERTAVDLAALLQEEIEILRQSLPEAIALRFNLPAAEASEPALGRILADPTHLHQILLNLGINARDAMAEGGTLTIAAETVVVDAAMAAQNLDAREGPYAVITVADTGTGIVPAVQERMFDPFFTTKAPGQGTGLGLATVRGLVKAHQGFLQVVSEVGRGSQFKVYFPQMVDQAVAQEPPEPASLPTSDNRGAWVLVVEDEATVRQMLRSLLESHHYRPLLAKNGAAALDLYRQHQGDIQLVVTDITMPILDGLTLIESLRTLDTQVPIIALSGIPTYQAQALALGATSFIDKPFDAETLLHQVAIALSRVQAVRPEAS
ncbi:PAS domain S-box protein [Leptolyngbya sp. KIOST-1]|uniref:PAS domain S-box protein n=1 Tax=Leptolyngbya sp. KIOST-1 TaxID=1229172 RepID=UPI000690CA8B|nr:PAS domain S-box protein [Leptolyngbya sp. KIOST-1]